MMKRSTLLITALSTAVLAGSVAAYAKGPGGHGGRGGDGPRGPAFEQLDQDGDGTVTRAELDAVAAEHFARVDADGNGTVTAEELAAQHEARRAERQQHRIARMIARLDDNDDGVLSQDELQRNRDSARFMRMFDTNDDGTVTLEEFEEARGDFGGRRGAGGHGRHGGGPRPSR